MPSATIFEALLAAGRAEDFAEIQHISGAGVRAQVLHFAESLKGVGLVEIERLFPHDRAAFAKALPVFENSVGGLGSVTALKRVLPLVPDEDHAILD